MAVIKCKMCGGDLTIAENVSVAECEYCGTKQTVPAVDDEKKITLFSRANRLRLACEFDKAAGIYESIVTEFPEEAEAYWGLVLCKYGIEYVDDPKTGKKIPTCHRSSFDSVMEDSDFEMVLEYADVVARGVYREEAKAIERIRQGILEVSTKEEPYDIFICYKETDLNGERTLDSVLAQDIYDALTEKGYRTFFARITLEDKLGQMYEPYIFAALNSAKVMLAIGTDYEYYNAVWVKNEWSRFLSLIEKGEKKTLIPCYKGLDAYDMPKEFKRLQAQDLGKVGAIQDLLRGIQKILVPADKTETIKETVIVNEKAASTEPLLKRAFMFLEDGDWEIADEYCERVLDIDPENGEAYLGKLMAELKVKTQDSLKDCEQPFCSNNNYLKIMRFGQETLVSELKGYIEFIKNRNENTRLEGMYRNALDMMQSADTEETYKTAARRFEAILDYKNSVDLSKDCHEKAEVARKEAIYSRAEQLCSARTEAGYLQAAEVFTSIRGYRDASERQKKCIEDAESAHKDDVYVSAIGWKNRADKEGFEEAIKLFASIPEWRDADEQINICKSKIVEIEVREEEARLQAEREKLEQKEEERRARRNRIIAAVAVLIVIAGYFVATKIIIPNQRYDAAVAQMEAGNYSEALSAFEALEGYKDSAAKISECEQAIIDRKYNEAIALMGAGNYTEAIVVFEDLEGYKDSAAKISECEATIIDGRYNEAIALMSVRNYTKAITAFEDLEGYKDSIDKISECKLAILEGKYNEAIALMDAGNLDEAYSIFCDLGDYKDSVAKADYIRLTKTKAALKSIQVGEYVEFGKYEQDNNTANGKESIEWLVLEVKDGKALLISKYGLDCREYNVTRRSVTWETCSLRKWLNNDFIRFAFSEEEKAMIPTVMVSPDKYPGWDTDPGKETQDQVFLLSITEVDKYFDIYGAGDCKPTAATKAKGAQIGEKETCIWWLRTPGQLQVEAACYHYNLIYDSGSAVWEADHVVRPALWIDLGA